MLFIPVKDVFVGKKKKSVYTAHKIWTILYHWTLKAFTNQKLVIIKDEWLYAGGLGGSPINWFGKPSVPFVNGHF